MENIPVMGKKGERMSLRVPLVVAGSSVGACLLLFLFRGIYVYWDSPPLINFLSSWIPFVLSILLAFVPSGKEMKHRWVKYTWRSAVVLIGFTWSLILWHQQILANVSNIAANKVLLTDAITQSNIHSDQQFGKVQENVGTVQKQVTGLGQSIDTTTKTISSDLEKTQAELDASIGKVGKPDPPIPAKLTFTLWDLTATVDNPVLSKTVDPDKDGAFPVEFALINGSESTADTIDIWVEVCDLCSFVKEPVGFEHPAGGDDHIRHRMIGSLNPGVTFEKITILVKSSAPNPFQIAFRYSCKTCGGKMSPTQFAVITQGPSLIPKQP
jgi:hypothetical protein